MDKNGKIFGKVSIIDVIALVLVAGVIAGTIYRFSAPSTRVDSGETKITYVLRINGVRPFTTKFYEVGLTCVDARTDEPIGVIKDIEVRPFLSNLMGTDGIPYKLERPNAVVIYLTVETDGRETDDAFYANGTHLLTIGSEVHLITKYINVVSTVEAINDISFVQETEQ